MAEDQHPPRLEQPSLPPPLPQPPGRPPFRRLARGAQALRAAWRRPGVRLGLAAVACAAVAYLVVWAMASWRERRVLAWREIAIREATVCGLDPALVLAVIRAESGGDPRAVSRSGAVGLMQLMPATAAAFARKLGLDPPTPEELFDPETNIRLGTRYLAHLRRLFHDQPWLYIAAYNAGPGNVDKWTLQNPELSPREVVEQVAYPQTRAYVRKVLAYWEEFRANLGTAADRAAPALATR